ncbi:MAG: rhomboid family intramembrane serine protease [Acidobacteriaceae bacterium]|nr:rhomboid family intramembrane serine protease [Acidobacteriaceae bacterium]
MKQRSQELEFERAEYEAQALPAEVDPAAAQAASWWTYPATYGLLAVNVVVFVVMFRYGPMMTALHHHDWTAVFTSQFSGETLALFGGCDTQMVLDGQWWRLLTACFVHGTVLHIALNMWCLWNLGLFGERLLGRYGMLAVYVLTGVAGNLMSLTWSIITRMDSLVVGASGAIFGITGVLIVLLSNRGLAKDGLSWDDIRGLRTQVVLFAAANLVLGAAPNFAPMLSTGTMRMLHVNPATMPHIDNSAHIGGFVCGLLLGWPLFSQMTLGKKAYRARQKAVFASAVLVLGLMGYALARFV